MHLHVLEDPNTSIEQPFTNFIEGEKIVSSSLFEDP